MKSYGHIFILRAIELSLASIKPSNYRLYNKLLRAIFSSPNTFNYLTQCRRLVLIPFGNSAGGKGLSVSSKFIRPLRMVTGQDWDSQQLSFFSSNPYPPQGVPGGLSTSI
uniref:Uncharacterized protein n=1 Tax=Helianthus annuus TaxID=4232 RepID=A0A5P8T014_HELAN|nr:hypothetical protein [Helianthus annuus]